MKTTRRKFVTGMATVCSAGALLPAVAEEHTEAEQNMATQLEDPRITRARLAGPASVTKDATVAIMHSTGEMEMLVKGSNEWICTPGDPDKIGEPPMCMNPMGMQWMMDGKARKPKPTNAAPGIIYMLCGATQHSTTDPTDQSSPAIPIGPHWMVTWPFDAEICGLPTTARDAGAWIMFAGTPYAYLHVCGDPWSGHVYERGDKAVWSMSYEKD